MSVVVAEVTQLFGVGTERKSLGTARREDGCVEGAWRDVGVGLLGDVVNNDVPELPVGVSCPMAEEQTVGHVGLHGSFRLTLVGGFVGLSVSTAYGRPYFGSEGYEVAVGRNGGTLRS